MRKHTLIALIWLTIFLCSCDFKERDDIIKFAVSADYPPFEYYEDGKIVGFDVELATLVAKELGREAVFEDIQFNAIFAALQSGSVDAAISTISVTNERKKNFDFSESYYSESLAMVYLNDTPITDVSQISQKKIACQLGTAMEIWLKAHVPDAKIITVDDNNKAIEALKVGHVDGVLIDATQGHVFSKKNHRLAYTVIAQADTGYAIALPKHFSLKDKVNAALQSLKASGELKKLEEKWLLSVNK